MTDLKTTSWHEANQQYLSAALGVIRELLESHSMRAQGRSLERQNDGVAWQALREMVTAMPFPPALETLCAAFNLSPFEREVLVLCAGMELDSTIAPLCASAQGDPLRAYPTFGLALAALSEPHWSALTPAAPLRHWRLIEVGTGSGFTSCPLRVEESVLNYLTGTPHRDERLAGIMDPVPTVNDLVPSHRVLAERIAATWAGIKGRTVFPLIQLCGDGMEDGRKVVSAACRSVGLNLVEISPQAIPTHPSELEALRRLWEREAALHSSALLVNCKDADPVDAIRSAAIVRLLEYTRGVIVVAGRERLPTLQRPTISFDVREPSSGERRAIWQQVLGGKAVSLNGNIDGVISQFSLNEAAIRNACAEALSHRGAGNGQEPHLSDDFASALWDICRAQARPRLDDLAQRIEPFATWDDLVLPESQRQVLRTICTHVRQRATVYDRWGFTTKSARGLGISALFAGASGTGKTMAAEVLANELRLDLYRIDLSQVVSKYIGETEKNLRRVFRAAEGGAAILLFDEADALFGKRSEVKDSHDRYANIEISYLLQRMESYRGLAILTTNMKEAIDPAFMRRIRFVVQFPFPDAAQRAEIWRRIFPTDTPTEELNVTKLARLNATGSTIRNVALSAAFLAANAKEPVRMSHLLRAARAEYGKLERPLSEAEIGGWI